MRKIAKENYFELFCSKAQL